VRVLPIGEYPDHSSIALRLAPIDVGFDLRVTATNVEVPHGTTVASYEHGGECLVVEGTLADVWEVLESAGYTLVEAP
jgi:hypothetical protein